MPLDLARLRRRPDVEHATLQAHDAADRLLLDEAAVFVSPILIGDSEAASAVRSRSAPAGSIATLPRWRIIALRRRGEDALLQLRRPLGEPSERPA